MSRQKSSFRLIILSIPLVLFTSSITFANGLELSGHVSVLAGWQYDDSDTKIYDGAIGIGYSLTDDTLVKWEYRLDWHAPDRGDNSLSHAMTGSFAYTF